MLFLAGLFVGFFFGFFAAGLCNIAAKKEEIHIERRSHPLRRKIKRAA
jgi:hypothetical protein